MVNSSDQDQLLMSLHDFNVDHILFAQSILSIQWHDFLGNMKWTWEGFRGKIWSYEFVFSACSAEWLIIKVFSNWDDLSKKYQSYISYLSAVVSSNGGNPFHYKKHCHKWVVSRPCPLGLRVEWEGFVRCADRWVLVPVFFFISISLSLFC